MSCLWRFLNISYKDYVINEEVHNKIQDSVGVHNDLLATMKMRNLRWYGHIASLSCMPKTILQRKVKGARMIWGKTVDWIFTQGNGRQKKMQKKGCNIISGIPTTFKGKELNWTDLLNYKHTWLKIFERLRLRNNKWNRKLCIKW